MNRALRVERPQKSSKSRCFAFLRTRFGITVGNRGKDFLPRRREEREGF